MADARVEGADAFYKLSKRLKEVDGTGAGSLRNEMNKALKAAVRPVVPKVKEAARSKLPKRGGLNERIAKRTPAVVTAIQDKKTDPRINAQERLWHPIFGREGANEDGKKNSTVTRARGAKGYFTDTIEGEAPAVRDDVVEVLVDYAKRLTRPL